MLPAFGFIESECAKKLAVDARRPIILLRLQRHATTMATNEEWRKRVLFNAELGGLALA